MIRSRATWQIVIPAVLLGLAFSIFIFTQSSAPEGDQAAIPPPPPEPLLDFIALGHLVKNNPGLKPDIWYLVYERPGEPALYAELLFTENSECSFGGTKGICPDVLLPSSALTEIQGVRQGNGAVLVKTARSGSVGN